MQFVNKFLIKRYIGIYATTRYQTPINSPLPDTLLYCSARFSFFAVNFLQIPHTNFCWYISIEYDW